MTATASAAGPGPGADNADLRLIKRAAAGDTVAFEGFLLQYRGPLLKYLQRHVPADVRRLAEPQDILQDVYFEAFRRLGSFTATDGRSAVRWLVTMARNRIIDLVRMQRADKRGGGRPDATAGLDPESDQAVIQLLQELAVYERTPSQSAVAHELVATVQRLLECLPRDYGQALRLRYIEGLRVEEIAARMGRTSRAVHMLCNRGLKSLRSQVHSATRYL